ncbi:MAG: class I SAM-dependent methyltransferase [Myxococcota bacterium]
MSSTRSGPPCPVCRATARDLFLEIAAAPAHVGAVWPDAASARACPRGDISLAFCHRCGFISNVAFDPAIIDYDIHYDNALHFSALFRSYEKALATQLVERHGIRNKDIIEIGCGSGHFLGLMCQLGDNRGVGFDPSHDPALADPSLDERVSVVRDYYSEQYADRTADLICCRHVLEHIPEPVPFLTALRRAVEQQPDAVLYFEVPNAFLALRELSIWDVIYEHTLYFVPDVLAYLFRACGFEVLDIREPYDRQFIGLEAKIAAEWEPGATPPLPDLGKLVDEVGAYGRYFAQKRDEWQARMNEFDAQGKRVFVWGAGAKAVSFLHLLEVADRIPAVVDINPGKQGSFIAGGGQPIIAPERLARMDPDVVVVMNPIYKDEIAQQLRDLGVSPEMLAV